MIQTREQLVGGTPLCNESSVEVSASRAGNRFSTVKSNDHFDFDADSHSLWVVRTVAATQFSRFYTNNCVRPLR